MNPQSVERCLRRFNRLFHDRQFRATQQCFPVEGIRNVVAAARSSCDFESIIYSSRLLRSPAGRAIVKLCRDNGTPTFAVSPEQFRTVAKLSRASGLAAIVRKQMFRLRDYTPPDDARLIGLSRVLSPGNIGSLIRTATAFGVSGCILIGQSIDPTDPGIVRASMGAFFKQRFLRCSWPEFVEWKQQFEMIVVGACPTGEPIHAKSEWQQRSVLMLGEERKGLSSRQKGRCDRLVRIPMVDGSDSLNLAAAGSILLYEMMVRQRISTSRHYDPE